MYPQTPSNADKLCPSCGRQCPHTAFRCTCGHQFTTIFQAPVDPNAGQTQQFMPQQPAPIQQTQQVPPQHMHPQQQFQAHPTHNADADHQRRVASHGVRPPSQPHGATVPAKLPQGPSSIFDTVVARPSSHGEFNFHLKHLKS